MPFYDEEKLHLVQNKIKQILLEIDKICKENNINYFVIAGTLLGAVRHKDIIPWDDDIDIGMLREDYNKFINVARQSLPSHLACVNFENYKNVPISFTKVCDTDTILLEKESQKLRYPHGIFVDILPFDYTVENFKLREKQLHKYRFYHELFKDKVLWSISSISNKRRKIIGKFLRPIIHILLLPVPRKYIYKKMLKVSTKYNILEKRNLYLCYKGYSKYVFKYDEYFPLVNLPYGKMMVPAPHSYDHILSTIYGNYMALPPEEKRIGHAPYKLEFDINNRNQILYFGNMDLPYNNASACRVMGISHSLRSHGLNCFLYGHSSKTSTCNIDGIKCTNDLYPNSIIKKVFMGRKSKIKKTLDLFCPTKIKAIFFTTISHSQIHYLGKWAKKNSVPLIYDCGDNIGFSQKGIIFTILKKIERRLSLKYIKKYCSVMTISSYLNNKYSSYGVKTFIVPCIGTIDEKRFGDIDIEFDKNLINIGYIGSPGKNFFKDRLDWCIDAFEKKCMNVRFYICGIEKKDLPKRYCDCKNVIFLGKKKNAECLSIIKNLDFTVLFREDNVVSRAGFPSKITESLLCGTPVLTNLTSDLKNYLNYNNSITVAGYTHEDCDWLFNKLNSVTKSEVNQMKSEISMNNPLNSKMWSKIIMQEIEKLSERDEK